MIWTARPLNKGLATTLPDPGSGGSLRLRRDGPGRLATFNGRLHGLGACLAGMAVAAACSKLDPTDRVNDSVGRHTRAHVRGRNATFSGHYSAECPVRPGPEWQPGRPCRHERGTHPADRLSGRPGKLQGPEEAHLERPAPPRGRRARRFRGRGEPGSWAE